MGLAAAYEPRHPDESLLYQVEMSTPVRITHPFHPLYGQEIEIVDRRHQWGDDRIFYRDPDGYLLSLPTRWTSLAPEDPVVIAGAGRSVFRVADLIELAAVVGGDSHGRGSG